MDVLDRIFSIAHKYNVELKEEDQKVELAEAKLKDGTTVVTPAEAMAVGVEVFVVNADGEQMPVPDGDYELENGAKISVEGGKIEAIEEAPVEAPAEPAEEVEASTETVEEVEAEKEEKEELTLESITALVDEKVAEALNKYKEEMEDKEKEKEEKMAKMEESFTAQLPAKAKVKKKEKVNFKELNQKQRVSALFNQYYNG